MVVTRHVLNDVHDVEYGDVLDVIPISLTRAVTAAWCHLLRSLAWT